MRYAIVTLIVTILAISFIPEEATLGFKITKQLEQHREKQQQLLRELQ